jgi:ERCC4-type nuclease
MTSWYINKIIVDSRERTRGYNAYNYYDKTYNVGVETLPYGDYLFFTNDGKQVIFEFKTCEDFIKSMEDKSLFNELSNQTIKYAYSYLVICGDFNEVFDYLYWNVPHYRYKYKTLRVLRNRLNAQVNGALNRLYAMYVPIVFVDDEEAGFEEMLKISLKIADTKKYGGIVRPDTSNLEDNPCNIFLTSIRGIGEKKSKRIIDTFNVECLDDLCKLKPSDFLSINKVNEENVRNVWKKIHNETIDL